MNKTEKLARIISQIHAFEYSPFYDSDGEDIWDDLEETAKSGQDVDKRFFRNIAEFVLETLKTESESFANEKFAIILSRIHSHSLRPFYTETEPEYENDIPGWDGYFWDKLEDHSLDKEQVSKKFFQEMGKQVLMDID